MFALVLSIKKSNIGKNPITIIPDQLDGNLCPYPQQATFGKQWVSMTAENTVQWTESALISQFMEEFKDELAFRYIKMPKHDTTPLILAPKEGLTKITSDEAYWLSITPDTIQIQGKTEKGIFYGLQTIYQLFYQIGTEFMLPVCEILDWPDMMIRGISDENSRGQVGTVENTKKFIRFLSKFKLNTYQFYWEDMFRYEKYPEIGAHRGAWTKAEIKEIDDYAKMHCVDLFPILNSIGHMETYFWVDRFKELGEFPGAPCINVAHPKTYEFLGNLFDEIAPAFSSQSFHIGADESREIGFYGSKTLVEKEGFGNVYLKHYTFCINKLKQHGKKRIFLYHDIASNYEEVLKGLPKENAIFVFWEYDAKETYSRLKPIVEHGLPFVVSSSALNWFRIFPQIDDAIEANKCIIREGLKYGALGQINSSWGDNGNWEFREDRLNAFAASSAMSWNFKEFDEQIFHRVFIRTLFGNYGPELEDIWNHMRNLWPRMKSEPFNHFFSHFWRHPFAHYEHGGDLDPAGKEYSEDYKLQQLDYIEEALILIKLIEPTIKRNKENLEYFRYALLASKLLINKIQVTKKVEHLLKEKTIKRKEIHSLLLLVKTKYQSLRKKYERLWLMCARRPRLDNALRAFDWMIHWYDQKIKQLDQGITWKNPMLLGCWISHKDDPYKTDEPRYLRKTFSLTSEQIAGIEKITIQLTPGMYAELEINGKQICSWPKTPESTQLPLDLRNILMVLPKTTLNQGENMILIKVQDWPPGWPVAHLLLHIKFKTDPSLLIVTDPTWKSSTSPNGPWQRAISRGNPPSYMGEIYMPHFEKGWASLSTLDHYGRIVQVIKDPRMKAPISEFYPRMWQNGKPFY